MRNTKLPLWPAFFLFVGLTCFFPKTGLAYYFYCAYEDTGNISKCPYHRPSADTIHTLAIYCTGHQYPGELPSYWQMVWGSSGATIPQFFRDNSNDQFVLSCDPVIDTVEGDPSPFRHPSLEPTNTVCTGGGDGFPDGIFPQVDSVVDFAQYDEDGDAVVDGFFFIVLKANHNRGCACLSDFSYTTNDTTTSGDTILVLGERGVDIPVEADYEDTARFMHHCIHQWGHQFGLHDLHSAHC